MILLIGLGNPDKKYKNTRHNIGFEVLDKLAKEWKFSKKFNAEIANEIIEENKILLAKPQTYMNLSGKSVQSLMSFYHIGIENLWVVSDDIDIELGKIRIRKKGSSGGHKGIQSIIDHLNCNEFPRFRIGVKIEKLNKMPADKFVLGKFGKDEREIINKSINKTIAEIKKALQKGIEHTSV